jgi:hypothetical protein
MNDTALSIVLVIGIALLGFWMLVGLLLIVLWGAVKKRVKRVEAYINEPPVFSTRDLNLVKARENLSKEETEQIRDLLRARKEREARDQDTIDKATEYRSEI